MRLVAVAGLLWLASCGYQPAPRVDTGAAAYQKDLDGCESGSATTVNQHNAKRALDWFASPFTRWSSISDATRSCMVAKGYGGLRWCTAAELKDAPRRGTVVVTASGVQCSDPASAPKPS